MLIGSLGSALGRSENDEGWSLEGLVTFGSRHGLGELTAVCFPELFLVSFLLVHLCPESSFSTLLSPAS